MEADGDPFVRRGFLLQVVRPWGPNSQLKLGLHLGIFAIGGFLH